MSLVIQTRVALGVMKYADMKSGGALSQTATDMASTALNKGGIGSGEAGGGEVDDEMQTVQVTASVNSGGRMVFELEGEQYEVYNPFHQSLGIFSVWSAVRWKFHLVFLLGKYFY